ncbi:hypothetical protein RB195_002795 [Necator americanus]
MSLLLLCFIVQGALTVSSLSEKKNKEFSHSIQCAICELGSKSSAKGKAPTANSLESPSAEKAVNVAVAAFISGKRESSELGKNSEKSWLHGRSECDAKINSTTSCVSPDFLKILPEAEMVGPAFSELVAVGSGAS